jgi:hypothetical protein
MGAQVYISRHGRALLEYACGEASPGIPLTPDSLMAWFSACKPLTAIAIAMLMERGRLDLDDPVRRYLPELGLSRDVGISSMIVHFTGYELDLDKIELDDPRDIICGHLIGTADLMAQMADRCYLEKCRDRLYKEFVVGGIAIENARPGEYMVRYRSGQDLLQKTPAFYQQVTRDRLNKKFNHVYRYAEVLYDGHNPYIESIRNNIEHLVKILSTGNWTLLRRKPPYFLGIVTAAKDMESLVSHLLAGFTGRAIEPEDGLVMPV